MKTSPQGQVQLSKLIFTQNWEDPAVDEKALHLQEGDTVFTITSGGCNTLGFLRFNPSAIYCVDINPAQTFLMELKQAAFRNLSFEELHEFFGITKSKRRLETYNRIKNNLSPQALQFWEKHRRIINEGLLMNGRYEKFVKIAGVLLRVMQGKRKMEKFFALKSLQEQEEFYNNEWDNKRWRWLFKTMFNKKRLAKKGLNADYFHFDDGSSSFSESFYKRAGHAMKSIPASSNYFLSLYFLGHYLNASSLPAYLLPQNFELIKKNIDCIRPVTADSKYWLQQQPDNFFNAMSLSNICELMDDEDTYKLFDEVKRTCQNSGNIIFRNLMIPRDVPESLRYAIVKNDELSKSLQQMDRSFVYGKIAAYEIKK
jgi:S-adenosylmethionine-diacylglycerol 3-amino-3-carboxypropyl transferase